MIGQYLLLLTLIALAPAYRPCCRTLYARFVRVTARLSPQPEPVPDTHAARTRRAYIETVELCARLAVGMALVSIGAYVFLGWQPDLSFLGLPRDIPLPFLSLALFGVFFFWSFYGHLVGTAIFVAATLIQRLVLVRRLFDLVVKTLPWRPLPLLALGRSRVAHMVDPALFQPRSGLPFLLFATTSSLRIP